MSDELLPCPFGGLHNLQFMPGFVRCFGHTDWVTHERWNTRAESVTPEQPSPEALERARELLSPWIPNHLEGSKPMIIAMAEDVISRIAAALDARTPEHVISREAAAKVAEGMRPKGGRMWSSEQHACY